MSRSGAPGSGEGRVALVTGASSGIGAATAARLAEKGFTVFGTSRTPTRSATDGNAAGLIELDVRSDESVAGCVAEVLGQAGRIDVLVNNAGYALVGEAEGASVADAQQQLDTNFFGVVRLVGAVLPHMRERRAGRIINVSSLAGLTGVPFMSLYCASKFAMEGYSETLMHEVRPFGIDVSLVEPGFVDTPLSKGSKLASGMLSPYDGPRGAAMEEFLKRLADGIAPVRVADTILRAATAKRPRLRYRVGRDSVWLPRLRMVVPASRFEAGTRKMFKLDRTS